MVALLTPFIRAQWPQKRRDAVQIQTLMGCWPTYGGTGVWMWPDDGAAGGFNLTRPAGDPHQIHTHTTQIHTQVHTPTHTLMWQMQTTQKHTSWCVSDHNSWCWSLPFLLFLPQFPSVSCWAGKLKLTVDMFTSGDIYILLVSRIQLVFYSKHSPCSLIRFLIPVVMCPRHWFNLSKFNIF